MTREIHEIPPAPRHVRLRAVLWHWWPIAFAGFILGVYGGLITMMLFLARGGKQSDDLLLDAGSVVVEGTVTGVAGSGAEGQEPIRLSYTFQTDAGRQLEGQSFLHRPGTQVGDRVDIEFAPGAPHVSRPVGGRIAMVPALHSAFLWFFLSGLLCIGTWIVAVLRLRHLMAHGDVAVGEILRSHAVRYVSPMMRRVEYRFRDHRAREQTGSHWVRVRSALGLRLATNPKQIAVLHDRNGRGVSRLVMADDFVVQLDDRNAARRAHHP